MPSAKRSVVLITVSGHDTPGITSELARILAQNKAVVIDIAQAVIRHLLSLSILFEINADDEESVIKELLFKANQMGLKLEYRHPSATGPESLSRDPQGRLPFHYAVTLIATEITAQALHEVTAVLAQHRVNIDSIKRLSEGTFGCVEMIVSSPAEIDRQTLKKELLSIAKKLEADIALQAEGLYRRAKRLVVLDMDSTLIQSEVIDELARQCGPKVFDQVAAITHEAMNGKMNYDESLRKRVAQLKGMSQGDIDQVYRKIALTPGADDLIRALKKLGYKIALISGGFTFVAERLKERLGIDFVYANTLDMKDGKVTGQVIPPIVNAQRKADLLDVIAQQERIELDQVIAIGDGANDLLMLEKAGLGIAFNAKASVREKADLAISQRNMRSILYLLGLSERELAPLFKTGS